MSEAGSRSFHLDAEAAVGAIAALWDLDPADDRQWELLRFGATPGEAIENLAGVAFAPCRGLLAGIGPEVRVLPVEDRHSTPLLVCLSDGDGPMLCRGIEDAACLLVEREPSASAIVALLERLLAVAERLDSERRQAPAPHRGRGDQIAPPLAAFDPAESALRPRGAAAQIP